LDATLIARQSIVLGLSRSLKEFIDLEVQTKGCGNVSEDVRGLLRAENQKLVGLRSSPVKGFSEIRVSCLVSEKPLRGLRVLHGKRDIDPTLEAQ
jgi:hypothetical protein